MSRKKGRDRSVTRRDSDEDREARARRAESKTQPKQAVFAEDPPTDHEDHGEDPDDETMRKIPQIEAPIRDMRPREVEPRKIEPRKIERAGPLLEPVAPSPRAMMDDDRPTEVYDRAKGQRELVQSRDQIITGSTIREMMNNPKHKLSAALTQLLRRARSDLPKAEVDARASLRLRHDFEFERRVGYQLKLKLFDDTNKCVEVVAELDQDGRAIRRGSVFSKLIDI